MKHRLIFFVLAAVSLSCVMDLRTATTATPTLPPPTIAPTLTARPAATTTSAAEWRWERASAKLALMPTVTPAQRCTIKTGYPAGSLNLRDGPGMSYPVIAWLSEGDSLTIVTPGDWSYIQTTGAAGWINSKFCLEVTP
jgi:uncharacterized protein YgiM (DUF1202 family)